ncbi:unnamed protein product [Tetraodon nigroviridis]|uniref:(spotted green pufferfish) hypothetical protein n=1 Tax=Tetraodon nigroviridis TaxID=99883 RepID=Q4SC62_TETNG|nr:unnamed protein product [Tetraodon nigroviridis]
MTKTKEVDVSNSPTHVFFASPKERRLHLRQKMENGGGTEGSESPHAERELSAPPGEKKKINRAPSPARPKDVPGWSLTKIRGGIGAPSLTIKPGATHLGSRVSRRTVGGGLAGSAKERSKTSGKSSSSCASFSKNSGGKATKSTSARRKGVGRERRFRGFIQGLGLSRREALAHRQQLRAVRLRLRGQQTLREQRRRVQEQPGRRTRGRQAARRWPQGCPSARRQDLPTGEGFQGPGRPGGWRPGKGARLPAKSARSPRMTAGCPPAPPWLSQTSRRS